MNRNSGGVRRANRIGRTRRQGEDGRFVGFRNCVVDDAEGDHHGSRVGPDVNTAIDPLVIRPIGRSAADMEKDSQRGGGIASASNAVFAGVS